MSLLTMLVENRMVFFFYKSMQYVQNIVCLVYVCVCREFSWVPTASSSWPRSSIFTVSCCSSWISRYRALFASASSCVTTDTRYIIKWCELCIPRYQKTRACCARDEISDLAHPLHSLSESSSFASRDMHVYWWSSLIGSWDDGHCSCQADEICTGWRHHSGLTNALFSRLRLNTLPVDYPARPDDLAPTCPQTANLPLNSLQRELLHCSLRFVDSGWPTRFHPSPPLLFARCILCAFYFFVPGIPHVSGLIG